MAIKLDLGLRRYDLEDVDGNPIGTISFNPSDPGLLPRFETARDNIVAITKQATDVNSAAKIDELDKQIQAQLDYAFGSPVSRVLFASVSALAICEDGTLVVEHILDGLLPLIEKAMPAATAATNARAAKYTAKYEQDARAGLAPGQLPGSGK